MIDLELISKLTPEQVSLAMKLLELQQPSKSKLIIPQQPSFNPGNIEVDTANYIEQTTEEKIETLQSAINQGLKIEFLYDASRLKLHSKDDLLSVDIVRSRLKSKANTKDVMSWQILKMKDVCIDICS